MPAKGVEARIAAAKTDKARRKARFDAIAEVFGGVDEWVSADGVRFVVTEPLHVDAATGALRLSLLAAKDGVLLPGLDNPYYFDGPVPYHVVDRTAGVDAEVANVREDPLAAMRRNIETVVLNAARQRGWRR